LSGPGRAIPMTDDPEIPFRMSHAVQISLMKQSVDTLVRLGWIAVTAMITIGIGVLVALIVK
jgi:hypothetical protein